MRKGIGFRGGRMWGAWGEEGGGWCFGALGAGRARASVRKRRVRRVVRRPWCFIFCVGLDSVEDLGVFGRAK